MSKNVRSCRPQDDLGAATRLLWNGDCGVLPVLSGEGRVTGVVTDRDVCMAAWTHLKPLAEIPVEVAMASDLATCRADEPIADVLARLRARHVRRLPVVDDAGQLLGMISLVDIARVAEETGDPELAVDVSASLARIGAPPPDAR